MGYTLVTTWILLAIAAIIGFIIGWFLAKKLCKCDDSGLRAELNTAKIEANELKAKTQGLVGQLDAQKSEIAKLKTSGGDVLKHTQRIDELESAAAGAAAAASAATLAAQMKHDGEVNALKAELTAATTKHAEAEQKIQGFASTDAGSSASADSAKLVARIAELEAEQAKATASLSAATDGSTKLRARIAELEAQSVEAQNLEAQSTPQNFAGAAVTPNLSTEQLAVGASALGLAKLDMDDLKVVEGIGSKIDELLVASGITTWNQLSNMPVEQLQAILDAGGPNFGGATPDTWARQAELLANGRWAEFKTLTDQLDGGR
jgi:predicted flap endonuclease-1-like 5' DNA nuclease